MLYLNTLSSLNMSIKQYLKIFMPMILECHASFLVSLISHSKIEFFIFSKNQIAIPLFLFCIRPNLGNRFELISSLKYSL